MSVHLKGKVGRLYLRVQADACEIVTVEVDVQLTQRLGNPQRLVQILGNPDSAGTDPDHERLPTARTFQMLAQIHGHPAEQGRNVGWARHASGCSVNQPSRMSCAATGSRTEVSSPRSRSREHAAIVVRRSSTISTGSR